VLQKGRWERGNTDQGLRVKGIRSLSKREVFCQLNTTGLLERSNREAHTKKSPLRVTCLGEMGGVKEKSADRTVGEKYEREKRVQKNRGRGAKVKRTNDVSLKMGEKQEEKTEKNG